MSEKELIVLGQNKLGFPWSMTLPDCFRGIVRKAGFIQEERCNMKRSEIEKVLDEFGITMHVSQGEMKENMNVLVKEIIRLRREDRNK